MTRLFAWSRLSRYRRDHETESQRHDESDGDVNLLIPNVNDNDITEPTDLLTSSSLPPPEVAPDTPVNCSDRSRHRRRHRSSRNKLCRCKKKESNIAAATCSMIVIVIISTALAEPQWFTIQGAKCTNSAEARVTYLGVTVFFSQGDLSYKYDTGKAQKLVYRYGPENTDVLVDCVTAEIVMLMKLIIALCFVIITFNMCAFVLDLTGPTHRVFKAFRSNAVFSILSAITCIVVNGFCYMVTEQLTSFYNSKNTHAEANVDFSISFYLITAAGVLSVIGTACNMLRRPKSCLRSDRRSRRDRLLADYEEYGPRGSSCALYPAPPPPYSP